MLHWTALLYCDLYACLIAEILHFFPKQAYFFTFSIEHKTCSWTRGKTINQPFSRVVRSSFYSSFSTEKSCYSNINLKLMKNHLCGFQWVSAGNNNNNNVNTRILFFPFPPTYFSNIINNLPKKGPCWVYDDCHSLKSRPTEHMWTKVRWENFILSSCCPMTLMVGRW